MREITHPTACLQDIAGTGRGSEDVTIDEIRTNIKLGNEALREIDDTVFIHAGTYEDVRGAKAKSAPNSNTITIYDKYFYTNRKKTRRRPSDGGYTIGHELGHAALGLPLAAQPLVDGRDIFARIYLDERYVYGYRQPGVAAARVHGVENHNDTFICSMGFQC